jgi:ABC-2 type transport system permease protein
MTAQSIPSGAVAAPRPADRRFAGLGALLRKDTTEWLRGRRAWVVLVVSIGFMALTAANGWIITRIAAMLPPDAGTDVGQVSLVPLDNLLAGVASQLFVLATILAVGSVLVAERQAGTLAWVASKPVSRRSIWLAKWISSTGMIAVTAVAVPLAVTVGLVVVLYGAVDPVVVVGLAAGMVAMVTFFTAVGILAGTVLTSQVGVVGVGFGVFVLLPILGALLPAPVAAMLPTSMLTWFAGLVTGMPVPWTTPVAFAITVAVIVAIGLRRIERIEL